MDIEYQIKTRWVGDGASTLWRWQPIPFFSNLKEALDYEAKHRGEIEPIYNWKLEIQIFRVELVKIP